MTWRSRTQIGRTGRLADASTGTSGRPAKLDDFEGVENCMTEKEARQEAEPCLRCDHFGDRNL